MYEHHENNILLEIFIEIEINFFMARVIIKS